MSPLAISRSASSTLPAVGFHLHGHRKALQLDSRGDSSSSSAAPIPVGSVQGLFSNLLQTLQKAANATSGTGGAAASSAGGTAPAAAAAGAGHSFNNLVKGSRVNASV
jgi:hypothetical protein